VRSVLIGAAFNIREFLHGLKGSDHFVEVEEVGLEVVLDEVVDGQVQSFLDEREVALALLQLKHAEVLHHEVQVVGNEDGLFPHSPEVLLGHPVEEPHHLLRSSG
jgi:hypothetical protein